MPFLIEALWLTDIVFMIVENIHLGIHCDDVSLLYLSVCYAFANFNPSSITEARSQKHLTDVICTMRTSYRRLLNENISNRH